MIFVRETIVVMPEKTGGILKCLQRVFEIKYTPSHIPMLVKSNIYWIHIMF